MDRITALHCCARLLLLAPALMLTACSFPELHRRSDPDRLAVVAGDTGTVLVTTSWDHCPAVCPSAGGLVFDYVVQGLPPNVFYTTDTSLQTPATPGLVRITFDVRSDASPGVYPLLIVPSLAGHALEAAALTLRVLPAGGTSPGVDAVSIAAGPEFSLAALADGSVVGSGANRFGQLGLGHRRHQPTPSPALGLDGIVEVAAGTDSAVALSANGRAFNWGILGPRGFLVNSEDMFPTPRPVANLFNVQAVAAGANMLMALRSDGSVWAWGANSFGQLGDGSDEGTMTPVRVLNLPRARAIAGGLNTAFAVALDGSVWKWGAGGLGVAQTSTPTQVPGLSGITAIAAGDVSALALDADGQVWSWGENDLGQLGDGTTTDRLTPAVIPNLGNVTAIAIGGKRAVALRNDGTVWEWGQSAIDPSIGRATPAMVPGLPEIRRVAVADDHTLVLSRCGQIWGWGSNARGGLGDAGVVIELPMLLAGIGDDGGCDRVTIRVSISGGSDRVPSDLIVGSPTPLQHDGQDFVATAASGTNVTLRALPEFVSPDSGERFAFDGWSADCSGSALQTSIVLERRKHCVARYRSVETNARLLTVGSGGGHVTSSGGGILGPEAIDCGDTCHAVFPLGTIVTLSLVEGAPGFRFNGWSGDCSGTNEQTTVTLDAARRCLATFRPFRVDVSVTGSGRVTDTTGTLDCGSECSFTPLTGTATLVAAAATGWRFDGWGGDCAGTATDLALVVDADKHCTASFSRIPGLAFLTMVVEGQGSVTSQPAGVTCPGACEALFPTGSTVDLTALPAAGWNVSFWFDDCANGIFGTTTNQVVMSGDRVCRVRFTTQQRTPVAVFVVSPPVPRSVGQVLTFDGSGSHVLDPATGNQDFTDIRSFSWDFDGDGTFDVTGSRAEAAVVEHSYPASGDYAVRLRVRGGPFDDFNDVVHLVRAGVPSEFTLTVVVNKPSGSFGSVMAVSPPGNTIDCRGSTGPMCAQAFAPGTVVVVRPDDSSIELGRFGGWSGCDSVGVLFACTVTLTGDRTVTAVFSQ
jgi:alpha-tubulin suppressor-like RCC1 family protein